MSQQPIIFDGANGLASDALIRLVRLRSLEAGKEKDDSWIAITASACFEGDALEWYEDQTEETQDSWKLLRRALLQRWPPGAMSSRVGSQSGEDLTPSHGGIPTPAAAPPLSYGGGQQQSFQPAASHTSLITGRIRVDYRNGVTSGYISKFTMKGDEYVTTPDKAKALVVAFVQSRDPHEMIIVSSFGTEGIGIACKEAALSEIDGWMKEEDVDSFRLSPLKRASPTAAWVPQSNQRAGGVKAGIWTVLMNGAIVIIWTLSEGRARYVLDAAVHQSSDPSDRGRIILTTTFSGLAKSDQEDKLDRNLVQVDFHFEPL